jgi:hypothetical protein
VAPATSLRARRSSRHGPVSTPSWPTAGRRATPGDGLVRRLPPRALRTAGARPGDLLVATEGGALTDAVSCTTTGCRIRLVVVAPTIAHAEGQIAFAQTR